MAEWFKAAPLKGADRKVRGFESYSLRHLAHRLRMHPIVEATMDSLPLRMTLIFCVLLGLSIALVLPSLNYVWISDGIHLAQGFFFACSIVSLILGLRYSRRFAFVVSLAALVSGLLVREDTLAVVPATIILGYVYARRTKTASITTLHVYTGAVATFCILGAHLRVARSAGRAGDVGGP